MARFQIKPREDGLGPYRWSHVVKNPNGGNLRQGSIYRQMGDELDAQDVTKLIGLCDKNGFDNSHNTKGLRYGKYRYI